MIKRLNLKALENRMTKTVSTAEALEDVTPFSTTEKFPPDRATILVDKDKKQCVKEETSF